MGRKTKTHKKHDNHVYPLCNKLKSKKKLKSLTGNLANFSVPRCNYLNWSCKLSQSNSWDSKNPPVIPDRFSKSEGCWDVAWDAARPCLMRQLWGSALSQELVGPTDWSLTLCCHGPLLTNLRVENMGRKTTPGGDPGSLAQCPGPWESKLYVPSLTCFQTMNCCL